MLRLNKLHFSIDEKILKKYCGPEKDEIKYQLPEQQPSTIQPPNLI